MLAGSGLTFADVSEQLGVGRSTLYRHLLAVGDAPQWSEAAANRRPDRVGTQTPNQIDTGRSHGHSSLAIVAPPLSGCSPCRIPCDN